MEFGGTAFTGVLSDVDDCLRANGQRRIVKECTVV